jgi:hypothetical protein
MRKNLLALAFCVMLGCCLVSSANGQQAVNIITTAVPFLRISPDARTGGMGDAGNCYKP